MKCIKCKHNMKREKIRDNVYQYRCKYCNTVIGKVEDKEDKSKDSGSSTVE